MSKIVLIVEPDASFRAQLGNAFSAKGMTFAEAPNMAQGIAALGGADFGAMIVEEGVRVSLRGICRLARKRHPAIHVLIRMQPESKVQEIQQAVGILINTCAATTSAHDMANLAATGMSVPTPFDFAPLSTGLVEADVRAALDAELAAGAMEIEGDNHDVFAGLEDDSSFSSSPAPIPAPSAPPDDAPLLEGSMEEDSGAALLMSLFAQELTGVLRVQDGPAQGALWFQNGEPLFVDLDGGVEAWRAWLSAKGWIDAAAPIPTKRAEDLLGAWVGNGALTQEVAQKALTDVIKERVVALARQTSGNWSFTEKSGFSSGMLQAKANPFGLIMDSMRRSMAPNQLFQVAHEMESRFVIPGPALERAAKKLMTFTRGVDVAQLIDGTTTVQDFQKSTGLDMLMGTLVVQVLSQCRLVTLEEQPRNLQANQIVLTAIPHDEKPEETAEPAQSVFDACVALMGLNDPYALLGVPKGASRGAVDTGYQKRLRQLSTDNVQSGSADALLQWRLGALKHRLQQAYERARG